LEYSGFQWYGEWRKSSIEWPTKRLLPPTKMVQSFLIDGREVPSTAWHSMSQIGYAMSQEWRRNSKLIFRLTVRQRAILVAVWKFVEFYLCVHKEINAFNRKTNKIIKPYEHTSQLHLNMQREEQAYRSGH